jgi:hypothetical protein
MLAIPAVQVGWSCGMSSEDRFPHPPQFKYSDVGSHPIASIRGQPL